LNKIYSCLLKIGEPLFGSVCKIKLKILP